VRRHARADSNPTTVQTIRTVFPAHAGLNRRIRPHRLAGGSVPRTRGAEPVQVPETHCVVMCSPHTRG
jgi:hypothetical protein